MPLAFYQCFQPMCEVSLCVKLKSSCKIVLGIKYIGKGQHNFVFIYNIIPNKTITTSASHWTIVMYYSH